MFCQVVAVKLYQQVLHLCWYLFVFEITISVIGLIYKLLSLCFYYFWYKETFGYSKAFSTMTLREFEYLKLIKDRNMVTLLNS